jgi:hypothetical protein
MKDNTTGHLSYNEWGEAAESQSRGKQEEKKIKIKIKENKKKGREKRGTNIQRYLQRNGVT